MTPDAPKQRPKILKRDPAAEMDAAVKKAEEAARRLRRAEDGLLAGFGDEEPLFTDEKEKEGKAPNRSP